MAWHGVAVCRLRLAGRHVARGTRRWVTLPTDLEKAHERAALQQSQRQRLISESLRAKVQELRPLETAAPDTETASAAATPDPLRLLVCWRGSFRGTRQRPDAASVDALLLAAQQELRRATTALLPLQLPPAAGSKLIVVGDTHGQLEDVLHIFHRHGPPSKERAYLFNGDISDRGAEAVEAWILILSFMLRYPGQVHILRGNHENEQLNERARSFGGGFAEECLAKYGPRIYERFQQLFLLLPLFAVIEKQIFVVHGGLFRTPQVTLERLKQLPYRRHYPMTLTKEEQASGKTWTEEEEILFDAQWADPVELPGITRSSRGSVVINFGPDVTEKFLQDNDLSLCIRSHQVPKTMDGYELLHNGRLLTIFSASHYAGRFSNSGGVAVLQRSGSQSSEPSLSMRFDCGLQLHCLEHELPEHSGGFAAQCAADGLAQFDAGAEQEAILQDALALICFHRQEILQRCVSMAPGGLMDFQAFLTILQELCSSRVPWQRIFFQKRSPPLEGVDYRQLLEAVKVEWLQLNTAEVGRLVRAMLEAEIQLSGLQAIFDSSQDGLVSLQELQHALQLLQPKMPEERAQHLAWLIAQNEGKEMSFGTMIDRLLVYAPSLSSDEPQQLQLGQLREGLIQWAEPADGSVHTALLHFFQAFDKDGDGVLPIPETVRGLRQIQEWSSSGGLYARLFGSRPDHDEDMDGLSELVELLDTNSTGTLSFLELARGLGEKQCPTKVNAAAVPQRVATAILEHREALLRACRSLDVDGTGQLPPQEFLMLLSAVTATDGLQDAIKQHCSPASKWS
ncbi:unnamed protein product [Cladocopium goreaui]|uniref:Serine/threonine-protein phosphatase n=1 Tax=Cladocopium goreaui TaxID=2562237 RepID=A0A9P1FH57_9DINO|nr:unnamed protein product [Cladocopium goreaui]